MIKVFIDHDEWWPWRSIISAEDDALSSCYAKKFLISEELYEKYTQFELQAKAIQQELRELEELHTPKVTKDESKTIESQEEG